MAERRSEKLGELERIKNDLARLESQAAERIGKLAIRAGLADLELSDELLSKEFAAVAAKFQPGAGGKGKPAAASARSSGES
ncbi:TraC family protein [Pseudomarimonas arenosa]|uniref:TraC family protein n=1 Tax=Pseudomarimonas arenosa TaxID=2774145 RepID=UPI001CDD66AD|nr:TraC family protein [Pseudomarimonas arenosa]